MTQLQFEPSRRAVQSIDRIRAHGDYRPQGGLEDALNRLQTLLNGERGNVLVAVARGEIKRLAADIQRFSGPLGPDIRNLTEELALTVRELGPEVGHSLEIESRPLFGALPIARLIPQDVHSVMDYAGGVATLAPAFFARKKQARIAGAALGLSVIGVSLLTDYRLSLKKLIPIEAHEATDYLWGAACIAAPFVFGYSKKDPVATALHVATGAAIIAESLFTDYRAAVGRGRPDVEVAAIMGTRVQPGISAHADYASG